MNLLCFVMLFISGRVTAQCIIYIHAKNERTRHGVIWTIHPTTHVLHIKNGMYAHIKAVTYVTFPNKQDLLPKLIRHKYKRTCQTRTYSRCMPL